MDPLVSLLVQLSQHALKQEFARPPQAGASVDGQQIDVEAGAAWTANRQTRITIELLPANPGLSSRPDEGVDPFRQVVIPVTEVVQQRITCTQARER